MRLIDFSRVDLDNVDTSECVYREDYLAAVEDYLDKQPTVDAVKVTRCSKCQHGRFDPEFRRLWCTVDLGCREVQADGYCDRGVKGNA